MTILSKSSLNSSSSCPDNDSIQQAFRVLEVTGLIERERDTNRIHIHRLLQVAFWYSDSGLNSVQRSQEAIAATAILLNKRFPQHVGNKGLHGCWAVCAAYLSHVRSLVHAFEAFNRRKRKLISTPAFDELLKNCCWYLYEAGLLSEGISLHKFATQQSLAPTGLNYATLCQAYGAIMYEMNDLPQARYWCERSLTIRRMHLNEDDADIANSHANMTNVLTSEGRFDESIATMDLATRYLSLDSVEDLEYIAMRKMMLGRAHYCDGDLATAQHLYAETEGVLAKMDPPDRFTHSL